MRIIYELILLKQIDFSERTLEAKGVRTEHIGFGK